MRMRVVIEAEFDVPDDELMKIYGTTDPEECAKIEAGNPPRDLLALGEIVRHDVRAVPCE